MAGKVHKLIKIMENILKQIIIVDRYQVFINYPNVTQKDL